MKISNIQKIATQILLIIFVLFVFLLFVRNRNVSLLFHENIASFNRHYLYTSLILLTGISFYIIIVNLSKNLRLYQKEKEMLLKEIAEISKEENLEELNEKEDNLKEIINSIIPKEKSADSSNKFAEELLINVSKNVEIVIGIAYLKNKKENTFSSIGTYAYYSDEPPKDIEFGISLAGQAAKDQRILNLSELPDNYITVISGLGKSTPNSLLIVPILHNNECIGIIEIASFKSFDKNHEKLFLEISKKISEIFNKFIK